MVAVAAACSPVPESGQAIHVTTPSRVASGAATAPRLASPARVGPTPASAPRSGQHPAGSPYAARSHGYDASYPQCADPHPPESASFAIVGVNGGKAFTRNGCLGDLWRAVRHGQPGSVYLNSGYNPDNAAFVGDSCHRRGSRLDASSSERTAYAIGCQEAVHSFTVLAQESVPRPSLCWVDVERSNSWDEADLNLNRFALQGLFDVLHDQGCAVGVYSTYAEWEEITGNWVTPSVDGDWVALARPDEACGLRGFSGARVWLVQELALWPQADYDSDWAC